MKNYLTDRTPEQFIHSLHQARQVLKAFGYETTNVEDNPCWAGWKYTSPLMRPDASFSHRTWVCVGRNGQGKPRKMLLIDHPVFGVDQQCHIDDARDKHVHLGQLNPTMYCWVLGIVLALEEAGIRCQIPNDLRKLVNVKVAEKEVEWKAAIDQAVDATEHWAVLV